MSKTIAVAGKGGSGKTTITSLIIRYLLKNKLGPVLAVDADPNANLGESLGIGIGKTVGSIIATFNEEKINIPPGMTKEAYLEVKLNDVIVESKGLDLVTMGRGEGPSCYCYPNLLLRKFMDRLADNYAYMVLDNEAGMEHLSRRTTQNVDELFLISNHSVKGVRTLGRLRDLVKELEVVVKRQSVVINMVPEKLDPLVSEELTKLGLEPAAIVPMDDKVYESDLKQRPLLEMPDDAISARVIDGLMTRLLQTEKVTK